MVDVTAQVISNFRSYYPEFSDSTAWPDADLRRALEDGDSETGSSRWGTYQANPVNFKARGLFAYAAHRAIINRNTKRAVEAGATPSAIAPVQSKTVGDESVSYSTPALQSEAGIKGTGNLDTTIYGQEFLRLRKRAGTGAVTTGQVKV